MPRPPRQLTYSPVVHVWSRGADRQDIFLDDHDRRAFVESLSSAVEHHAVAIHAYALMSNHHHAIIESLDGTAQPISDAMHRIGLETARRHNHRYERTGPLFENRFGMKEITSGRQLTVAARYVHRNPIVLPGALVDYPFSSLRAYTGRCARPSWLTTQRVAGEHGGTPADYERFVAQRQPGETGDSPPWPWVRSELAELDTAIEGHWSGARTNERSALAAALALDHRIASAHQVAEHHGFVSPAAARSAARRARSRRSVDPAQHARASSIERELGWVPMRSSRHHAA